MKHCIFISLFVATLAGIFWLCSSQAPEAWLLDPHENYYRSSWREHALICERESINRFFTFDEPKLPDYSDGSCKEEWYNDIDYVAPGVVIAPGKHGKGIKFNGDNDTFYALDYAWNVSYESFSMALWLKLNSMPTSQDIICTWTPKHIGLRLDRGKLRFDWSCSNSLESISYDFKKYKEFVHIAVIADRTSRKIRLYENGRCMAEGDYGDLYPFRWQLAFGKGNFAHNRDPLHGTIDDFAIWSRAISENELHDIVSSQYGLQDHFSSSKRRLALSKKKIRADLMWKLGRFFTVFTRRSTSRSYNPPAQIETEPIRIYLRDPDQRKLARIHAKSSRSGSLASDDSVEAFVTISGKTTECKISLAGGTTYYPYTDRPAYAIEPLDAKATFPNGLRSIELRPPEKAGWIIPLAISEIRKECNLGHALRKDCSLARLNINGMNRGIYLMHDTSRLSVTQDYDRDVLYCQESNQPFLQKNAEIEQVSPMAIDKATCNLAVMLSPQSRESIERTITEAAEILSHDRTSSVPCHFRFKFIDQQLATCRKIISGYASSGLADMSITPAMFLASNPCPWCITSDIDTSRFSNALPNGTGVVFDSSNTNLIAKTGKVTRPAARPELVTLTATLTNDLGVIRSIPMQFRIMPLTNSPPAVFVWTPMPLGRTHRTKSKVEIFDFNITNGIARSFEGFAKIRYRGNTSFRGTKKLINIKTDRPHRWLSDSDTTHLLAINARTDIMRVWNKLAYDLFRSFPRLDSTPNIAPHVKTAELFVNGHYWSLIEFAERLDEHLWGDTELIAFRHRIAAPKIPYMRQASHDATQIDTLDTFLQLEDLLSSFDGSDEMLKQIIASLDITSVIDYMILFSLFANTNGGNCDFFMQDCLMYNPASKKFFYIPWDFDTLMLSRPGIIETNLNRLLAKAYPDYNNLVLGRWQELRKTVLSTEYVLAMYDRIASGHSEYLQFEYMKWYPDQTSNAKALIELGREKMAYRLEKLDRLFAERCEPLDE